MYDVADIFVQAPMSVMWNVCIVLGVTSLIAVILYGVYVYSHSGLISAHVLIGTCGIYGTF